MSASINVSSGLKSSDLKSFGGDLSLGGSLRRIALQDADSPDLTRSISGRLGYRGLSASTVTTLSLRGSLPTEETGLLGGDGEAGNPPLSRWIFPALCCAAAYAFYNVSKYSMQCKMKMCYTKFNLEIASRTWN